jgi:mono/diheme cytochrome c family protein
MRFVTLLSLVFLAACGGSDPAPAPTPEPAKEKPAEKPAKAKQKAKAKADPMEEFDKLATDEEKQAFLMKLGEKVYKTGDGGIACMTCHGAEGKGTPGAFPPLVGQKDHMGDCKKHAGIVINGLQGEMVVDGVTYNGVMTPQGSMLNDLQIAAVISYERQSWGNDFGYCMPDAVASAR